ncbi:MAG: hypothetical protein ACRDRG_03645 [Pseudonocardiaceae bacterium]
MQLPAEAGDTTAAAGLGVLLEQCGDLADAETWYRIVLTRAVLI